MAMPINLQPPPSFDFKSPDTWSRWRRRFEQFRIASGLADDTPARQTSTLLYCLGEEADSVLTTMNATAENRSDYDKVMELLDGYFQVRRNVIFERARFDRRSQLPGESAEEYIMDLYSLAAALEGVVCQMDDVLVFGSSRAEHDVHLLAALKRIDDAGATLNIEKCEFSKTSITFLGHRIDQSGISADPEKTKAIREMRAPTTMPELRRFMGMVNQLGKFTSNLAHLTQPLRALLSKGTDWMWGPDQRKAFTHVKEELSKPTTLALYDTEAPTKLSADASSYGLGAVLMQKT